MIEEKYMSNVRVFEVWSEHREGEMANIEGRNREECSGILVFGSAVMSRFVTMRSENVTIRDNVVVRQDPRGIPPGVYGHSYPYEI